MKLSAKVQCGFSTEPFLALVEQPLERGQHVFRNIGECVPTSARFRFGESSDPLAPDEVRLPDDLRYLSDGDIVRINPQAGEIRVLYRRTSRHNVLFFTERCNSRCLMCSQPPRDINDDYLVEDILRMIPWMAKDTPELGITGGEPTLLHDKLIEVIACAKHHLPKTSLHMLSNGRLLSYLQYARRIAELGHPDFMIGIPLYADTADVHDFVVQSKGAFAQTIFGLLNLGRVGVRIELRMVVHRQTFARLSQFARFVTRNLPFVDQVVFMGLELMGYARSNLDALWIDPVEYQEQLAEAVGMLDDAGLNVSVFNHQLCTLPLSLHPFARKSISDWKNTYMPECAGCGRKDECGGFFASATLRYSRHIKPFSECS